MINEEEIKSVELAARKNGRQAFNMKMESRLREKVREWSHLNRVSDTKFIEVAIMRLVAECEKRPKPEFPIV